mmetsp:Transcript_44072/g.71761  ORF Transcript_44072/g.71761 Transcript_44072/m.71761 type:complete len:227 (-) Transcript_44072:148-828(-)
MTDLNTYLSTVKARAEDLRSAICRFDFNRNLSWTELLQQFEIIATQAYRINEEISPVLQHFVIHPKAPTPDLQRIPDLLRTKALPEVEQYEQQLYELYQASSVANASPAAQTPTGRVSQPQESIEKFDRAIERLVLQINEQRENVVLAVKKAGESPANLPTSSDTALLSSAARGPMAAPGPVIVSQIAKQARVGVAKSPRTAAAVAPGLGIQHPTLPPSGRQTTRR